VEWASELALAQELAHTQAETDAAARWVARMQAMVEV
jgi:hypothetical protein